ncbi:myelin-associated glycoprotein-like [Stegostoma tigrinum]|uniref:myelin-associated glycoprotein-like n=1 Tax=Stegostoma tigrinum TaxID=3053191 RepID=UPI00202B5906|nr:myelin-associated glycoprotein-like [Stegostoma tigrinum]XP_048399396.1 myelin-associated glycoprotein-like [Stegostoma tigrinum]XP_048399397.1 myelin-associated glycoprotein-like [Stegostoma tigrinum]
MNTSQWTLALTVICLIQGSVCQWSVWVDDTVQAWEGESVTLNCSFQYPDPIRDPSTVTARWLKNSPFPNNHQAAEIYNSRNLEIVSPDVQLIGDLNERNCSLQIENIHKADTGIYYFRFELGQGNNWSGENGINVQVYGRPSKPDIRVPSEIIEGDEMVSVTCSTTNIDQRGRATLSWDGISDLTDWVPRTEEQWAGYSWSLTSNFAFIPSYQHHNRVIKCMVNYIPYPYSDEADLTLQIRYPPKNTVLLVNASQEEIKEGNCVTLVCVGNSFPEANYTWYKKDRFTNRTEVLSTVSSNILFQKISRKNSGFYNCMATNYLGSSLSSEIEIDVQYKPDKVTISQEVLYKCIAEASPPAVITWKISDESINLTDPRVSIKSEFNGTHSVSTLRLETTASFCVSCLAQNKHGVSVTERCPPGSFTKTLLLAVGVIASGVVVIIIFVIVAWRKKKEVIGGQELESDSQPVIYTEVQTPKKTQATQSETTGRRENEFAYANLQHESIGQRQAKAQSDKVEILGAV